MIEWSDIRDIDINYFIYTVYIYTSVNIRFFANFKSLAQNNFTWKSTIQMGKISFSSYVWGQVIHWTRARLDRCIRMSNFISVDFIKSEHVVAFWKCVCNFFFYIYFVYSSRAVWLCTIYRRRVTKWQFDDCKDEWCFLCKDVHTN